MADNGVYVMMVYPISNYQRFKNTMMRNQSIIANYSGELVCCEPEVKCVEGRWPANRTIAIIYFSSETLARKYLESDPTIKQPDFMDGMDIAIVQMQHKYAPADKKFFVIADVIITDAEAFANEYSTKVQQIQDNGKVAVTAVCPEPAMYRGTWKPHMLIINQWSSATDYNTFYNSDEYAPIKNLRQRITQSTVITLGTSI